MKGVRGARLRRGGRGALGLTLLAAVWGCVYFNTFYNAKKYYGEGEKLAAQDAQGSALPVGARAAFEKSIEKSSTVLASHPRSDYVDDALLLLGKAHYRLGNFAQATAALRTLLEQHPESGLRREAALWLVRAGRQGGDPETAARLADELLASGDLSREDRMAVEVERAELALAAGEPARAVAVYEELQRVEPDLARRHEVALRLARARLEQRDYDAALQDLRALTAAGASPELRRKAALATAEALAAAGRDLEAREAYQELLRGELADSLAAQVHAALAESYRASGELRSAADELEAAARLQPSTPLAASALYRRGLLQWKALKSRAAAKETFLEAYLQDPQAPAADSATAAARTIQEIQHYQAILAGSERVLSPLPPDEVQATATYLLAELLYAREDDVEGARVLFAGLLERHPGSAWRPKVLYTMGWLAEQGGRPTGSVEQPPDSAAAYYRRLVQEFPRTEYARYARERLAAPAPIAPSGAPAADPAPAETPLALQATVAPPAPVSVPARARGAGELPGAPAPPAADSGFAAPAPSAALDVAALPLPDSVFAVAADSPRDEVLAPIAGGEESVDARLLAFSRALPRAQDPLVGIQDRLLARQREEERPAGRGRAPLTASRIAANKRAEQVADSLAALRALRDSLGVASRNEGGQPGGLAAGGRRLDEPPGPLGGAGGGPAAFGEPDSVGRDTTFGRLPGFGDLDSLPRDTLR